MLKVAAACSSFEGVAPGYMNELAPSTTGDNNCRVATGGAMVDGKYYNNSANVDLVIDSASAGHYRIDRVVVRAAWATFTCSLVVIKNTVEDAVAPAITQTTGVTYDIQIAQVRVTDAGVITSVTDERTWAICETDGSTLEDSGGNLRVKDLGITTAKINDSAVTAAKIANRTRKLFVPAQHTDDSVNDTTGVDLVDGASDSAMGHFTVPSDFVSDMTVKAVIYPAGTGNVYSSHTAYLGAAGEAIGTHTVATGNQAVAVTANQYSVIQSLALVDAAAGDYIFVSYLRAGGNALDTVGAAVHMMGFLVEYTADS